jgi:hypothetical protein
MDKLPTGRYATAREMADDLSRFIEDRPIHARRLSFIERSARWSTKHRALVVTAIAGIVVSLAIGALALWRAKRQAEANLIRLKDAQVKERLAFEGAFGINDAITIPLINDAVIMGTWSAERRLQAYDQLICFYDRIATAFVPDDHQREVVAKASRKAGALRIMVGDRHGCADYARAIKLYEEMSAKAPAAIWYRTDLISTLREYASELGDLGDPEAAATCHRRAFEVADGLLADKNINIPCFRKGAIVEFNALVGILAQNPHTPAADRSLASRLTDWLSENP